MRAALRLLHRWIGLAAAAVLLVSGATGVALLVVDPLDARLNARLLAPGPAGGEPVDAAALDAAHARLAGEFPGASLSYYLPREPGASTKVYVRGGAWDGEVFLDGRGAELGRRGETEGLRNQLFELHSALLAGDAGKAVLFAAAIAYVALLAAGVALWWPRRWSAAAFRVARGAGWKRLAWDLHRVGGVLLGGLALVSVASGAYMAWRPLSKAVDAVTGTAGRSTPPVVSAPTTAAAAAVAPVAPVAPAPPSALLAAAERALPGGRASIVQWSPDPRRPARVRKRFDDEPHPNGLSMAWLHPVSAEPLRVTPWREASAGTLGFQFLYPLHTGELLGPAHRWIAGLAGLALAGLAVSGPLLWWARRRAPTRPASRAARPAAAAAAAPPTSLDSSRR